MPRKVGSGMTEKQRKAAKRKYHREYQRRYYDANYASLGLHRIGRPAKCGTDGCLTKFIHGMVNHAKKDG